MENINAFKAALSALLAALTALWGWFGWLVIAWIACMAIDYITGSCAAIRAGKWSSSVARDGIWHKMGCAVAVIVAAILDMVIGMITEEPVDERFTDAIPVMKNVHLVHQMINEQEKAIGQYLKLIRKLEGEDPTGKREMDGQSDYS